MTETYNVLHDVNEYKNDICQVLADIKIINDRLNLLNDLLIKHINGVCKDCTYVDNLICFDQLSNIFDIEYILRKQKIFYGYVIIDGKYINYNYFKLGNNEFSNTFSHNEVSSEYLKRDLETLDHILAIINKIIDTIK